ncbi:MAG: hypothetical protein H7Y04_07410, partial [Verrucomicrobia bacterium]|nr:hypothetical protein [Cytophagales bacterium]
MRKLLFYLTIVVLTIFMACCKATVNNKNTPEIKNENNSINLYFNGLPRLKGIKPLFEGSDFHPVKADISSNQLNFSANEKLSSIGFESQNGVLIFTLNPNKNHSRKGADFIGLFVDSLPAYQIGTAFYKYGSVKAWTHPVQVKSVGDLNEKDNQFFLWKY